MINEFKQYWKEKCRKNGERMEYFGSTQITKNQDQLQLERKKRCELLQKMSMKVEKVREHVINPIVWI